MRQYDHTLQEAVDYVGDLCKAQLERFEYERKVLPSWGTEVDRDVALYVLGLQDWIVGALHWSFDTARYFGDEGSAVMESRIVTLLPRHSKP